MRLPLPLRAVCFLTLLPSAVYAQSSAETTPATDSAARVDTSLQAKDATAIPQLELSPVSSNQRRKAEDAYLAGARSLDRKNPAAAIESFTKAATLDPANREYALALTLAREHRLTQLVQQAGSQRLQGHNAQADTLLAQAHAIDPDNQVVAQHIEAIAANSSLVDPYQPPTQPHYQGAIELAPKPDHQSFHLRGGATEVISSLVGSYGLKAVFDSSVTSDRPPFRLDLDDLTYEQAMPIVMMMSRCFAVPLDSKTVLVALDNTENRQRLEPLLLETFTVPSQTTAQITELSTLLKNVFDVKQVSLVPNTSSLVVRAPERTLKAINYTLGDMLDGGSEVVLDMRVYSIDATHNRNIGFSLPQTLGAYNVASTAQSAITANQSAINQAVSSGLLTLNGSATQNMFTELAFLFAAGLLNSTQFANTIATFGGGITTTALFAGGASLNFGLNSSDTRVLDSIQSRVGDRQTALIRVGSKYPIATAIYSSSVPNLPPSIANATVNGSSVQNLLNQFSSAAASIPQFQFEDLGLTLKAIPTIQKSGLITLQLDFKIEALAGGSLNSIPVLDSRVLTSTVTVGDGDSALIASNLTQSESNAVTGTPGLSELPGFQSVPNNDRQTETSHLVILITPHIVRKRSDATANARIAFTLPASDNN